MTDLNQNGPKQSYLEIIMTNESFPRVQRIIRDSDINKKKRKIKRIVTSLINDDIYLKNVLSLPKLQQKVSATSRNIENISKKEKIFSQQSRNQSEVVNDCLTQKDLSVAQSSKKEQSMIQQEEIDNQTFPMYKSHKNLRGKYDFRKTFQQPGLKGYVDFKNEYHIKGYAENTLPEISETPSNKISYSSNKIKFQFKDRFIELENNKIKHTNKMGYSPYYNGQKNKIIFQLK